MWPELESWLQNMAGVSSTPPYYGRSPSIPDFGGVARIYRAIRFHCPSVLRCGGWSCVGWDHVGHRHKSASVRQDYWKPSHREEPKSRPDDSYLPNSLSNCQRATGQRTCVALLDRGNEHHRRDYGVSNVMCELEGHGKSAGRRYARRTPRQRTGPKTPVPSLAPGTHDWPSKFLPLFAPQTARRTASAATTAFRSLPARDR